MNFDENKLHIKDLLHDCRKLVSDAWVELTWVGRFIGMPIVFVFLSYVGLCVLLAMAWDRIPWKSGWIWELLGSFLTWLLFRKKGGAR